MARIFVFVEGKSDRYFYSKLCESSLVSNGIPYEICLAQELPERTGGKSALLRFFKFLGQNRALLDTFHGKPTAALFFLDKDVDDFLSAQIISDHVVYTESYSLENYYFLQGDLIDSLAAAASLNPTVVRASIGVNNDDWCRRAAENWKEWVKLCLFSRIRNIDFDCNYSVNSRINDGPYSPLNTVEHEARLAELERRSGLTPIGFKRVFNRISKMVDETYERNEYNVVFKGLWYALFLAEDARRIAAGGAFNPNNLPERLLTSLQISLDFSKAWTRYFIHPIEIVAGRV